MTEQQIAQAHQFYCQWTGQRLSLRFDRQRAWFEFFRAGFTLADLQHVLTYLQREIRAGRRNLGALKLSNLLQLDRFEEDSQISRLRLRPPNAQPACRQPPDSQLPEKERHAGRQRALQLLAQLRSDLGS